jgi:hypothetical protein
VAEVAEGTAGVALGARQVQQLFPYLVEVDRELRLTALGRAVSKVCPGVGVGEPLMAWFRLPRAMLRPSFEAIQARGEQVFFLEAIRTGIRLRGLWTTDETGERLVFVGSPWFTEMSHVERSGLSLRDFTALDPLLDFLALGRAKDVALEDARRMSQLVEQQRDELQRTNEQLVQAAAVKAQFLANTSHELRTPLAGILGMAGLIQRSELSVVQRGHVDRLVRSAQGLLVVVNDLLDLSKLEAGKLIIEQLDTDLWTLVQDTAELFATSAEPKGVALSWALDPDVPRRVLGDPNRLRQVLGNLLGNAVKFTDQGQISLQVSTGFAADGGPVLRFAVADTGLGIDPTKPLFLPFEQADGSMARRYGGTGLGLAIARELVTLMDGSIGAERNRTAGSTFWFTVPLRDLEGHPEPAAPPPLRTDRAPAPSGSVRPARGSTRPRLVSSLPPLPGGAPRVLVVDDNLINRELACAMLEELGVACDLVASGPDALAALANRSYPLVLMDMQMPGMDGLTTTRALRAREAPGHRTPVLGLSALAMPEDRQRALDSGLDGYLSKPYSLADLSAVIEAWVHAPSAPPVPPAPRGAGLLESFRGIGMSDEFLAEIVALFLGELPGRQEAIREAFAAGGLSQVQEAIHALRSSALALGVSPLCEVCLRMEQLARGGDVAAARALLPAFEEACASARRTLGRSVVMPPA